MYDPTKSRLRPIVLPPYHSRMRFRLLVTLLIGLSPLRAAAQPVVGVVVEEGRGVPVSGAMVILFDESGDRVARMLTNAAGQFTLRARAPGTHHVTVERIGYANVTTARFAAGSEEVSLVIDVPIVPVALTGLDVESGRRCEVRPEEGRVTARVWEEVRKALAAEAWTREASLYTYTLRRFERTLDREGVFILTDSSVVSTKDAAFESAPIDKLAAEGFVQAEGDSSTVYYAPDAGALLSDAFLDTHCLSVRDGGDGRIGLMFEPVPERWVPEIVGVLWLDAETAELDWLEFGYVNLLRTPEIGEPGGEVSFARLPDGAWIVREWWIRMPRLEVARRRVWRAAYREEGGVTRSITDALGRTVLHSESASIFGVVTDSTGTGPPGDRVQVEIVGSGLPLLPDDDGSFLFNGLSPGPYALRVVTPRLHAWGLASPETAVVGELGEVAYARLRVPALADILDPACGGFPRPDGTAPVLGRVLGADGKPAGAARVEVRWPAATGYRAGPLASPPGYRGEPAYLWDSGRDGHYTTAVTTTDARGLFLLCDAPHGSRLGVAVSLPDGDEPVVSRTIFVPTDARTIVEVVNMSTRG